MAMPRDQLALLGAYVDGVGELSPDERHGVERALEDDAAKAEHAEVRGLIDRLRELPPEGAEPDWAAMERSIRDAVGAEVPRPWWRRWTAILPATTLVTGMAVLMLVMWGRGAQVVEVPLAVPPAHDAAPTREAAHEDGRDNVVALWLDGAEIDVDVSQAHDLLGAAPTADDETGEDEALLPSAGLAWVDNLDEAALDRAEHWLDSDHQEIPVRKKG